MEYIFHIFRQEIKTLQAPSEVKQSIPDRHRHPRIACADLPIRAAERR
jgi:hypothetical protein